MRKDIKDAKQTSQLVVLGRAAALAATLDAVEKLLKYERFMGKGKQQAQKVLRWTESCLNQVRYATKHRKAETSFQAIVADMKRSVYAQCGVDPEGYVTDLSLCAEVVACHVYLLESRRLHGGMDTPEWRWLMMTLDTMVMMIFAAVPDYEEAMCLAGINWCELQSLNKAGRFQQDTKCA